MSVIRRATAATIATVMAGALAGTALPASAGPADQVPPPCGPLAVNPPLALPAGRSPAAPVLRRLAANPATEPGDAQTGRYTRLTLTMAAADSTIGDCVSTTTAYATERRWRDERANSGRITGTPWHPDPAHPPATDTTWYGRGELRGTIPGRVPADPVRLAALLDQAYPPDTEAHAHRTRNLAQRAGAPPAAGTARRVLAVGDLVAWHHTNRPARQAVLTVLAGVADLHYRGRVTLAGRTGIAVSVADGASTHVLLIDAATGQIRVVEEVLTDPVIGRNLGVQVPYSLARTVMGPQGRSPGTGGGEPHTRAAEPA
jgi:hypothetical protein